MSPNKYKTLRQTVLELSQAELAERVGVRRETIIRRESGESPISVEAGLAIDLLVLIKEGGDS